MEGDLMKNFLKKYGHLWILGYGFIYLPWFIYLEKTITKHYHVMHSVVDDYIPFNEYFVIPYFLWLDVYKRQTLMYLSIQNMTPFFVSIIMPKFTTSRIRLF